MKEIKRALAFFLPSRNLMRKLPLELPPLFKKLVLEPGAITARDITSFIAIFNFDDIWIFPGVAMKQNEKAIVLSGPPGVGKSTLLRKVACMGMAEPIDDGFILVGRADGCYYVLDGGLYPTMRTTTVIGIWLRTLFRYRSPYLDIDNCHTMAKAIKRGKMLGNLAVLIGSIFTKNRRAEGFILSPVRLARLFLVTHPNNLNPARRLSGEKIGTPDTGDIERIFNTYASCEVIHSYEEGFRKALQEEILSYLRTKHVL